jgi:hypothetical protein
MLIDAINNNPNLQRHKVLFISGNYSRIADNRHIRHIQLDKGEPVNRTYDLFISNKQQ